MARVPSHAVSVSVVARPVPAHRAPGRSVHGGRPNAPQGGSLPLRISRASGAFPVDWNQARRNAQRTLASIDWSQRDIVLWVPGTSQASVNPAFAQAVASAWSGSDVSVSRVHYAANWNIRPSVATGIATMRLVLAGIAAHTGQHRVMLAGESQGAWVIGEAIADPTLRRVIDRAVLLGHPWLAAHQYLDGRDQGVRVLNNSGDLITIPMSGDPARGLEAMIAVHTLQFGQLPLVVRSMIENPRLGMKLIGTVRYAIPGLRNLWKNPHDYADRMAEAVGFLRDGR